ncbi:MAG: aspartate/glutamate racemase family protein [Rubrobacteraceae bacterium]
MRITAITPIRVGRSELTRRQARYDALSPPSVEVELIDLPDHPDVPRSLESDSDIRASERLVIEEATNLDPSRCDAILPDCVLDPGLDQLEAEASVPTFGILKLSAGFLLAAGHKFAAFTRNQAIGDELCGRLARYGYLPQFDRIAVLDLSFEDIANDEEWNKALREAGEQFLGSSTSAVINGCSAVELRPNSQDAVTIVDPTKLALLIIGLAADSGLTTQDVRNYSLGVGG